MGRNKKKEDKNVVEVLKLQKKKKKSKKSKKEKKNLERSRVPKVKKRKSHKSPEETVSCPVDVEDRMEEAPEAEVPTDTFGEIFKSTLRSCLWEWVLERFQAAFENEDGSTGGLHWRIVLYGILETCQRLELQDYHQLQNYRYPKLYLSFWSVRAGFKIMQEWTGEKSTATISKEFSALFTMSEPLSPMNWKSRAVACFLVKKLIEIKGTRIIDAEDKKRHNIARFQCDYNKKLQDCLEFATFSFRQEWLEWKKYPLQIPAVFSPHFRSKGSIKMGKLFDYGPLNWLQIPIPEASQVAQRETPVVCSPNECLLDLAYASWQQSANELEKKVNRRKAAETSAKVMKMLGASYCRVMQKPRVDFVEDAEVFLAYFSGLISGTVPDAIDVERTFYIAESGAASSSDGVVVEDQNADEITSPPMKKVKKRKMMEDVDRGTAGGAEPVPKLTEKEVDKSNSKSRRRKEREKLLAAEKEKRDAGEKQTKEMEASNREIALVTTRRTGENSDEERLRLAWVAKAKANFGVGRQIALPKANWSKLSKIVAITEEKADSDAESSSSSRSSKDSGSAVDESSEIETAGEKDSSDDAVSDVEDGETGEKIEILEVEEVLDGETGEKNPSDVEIPEVEKVSDVETGEKESSDEEIPEVEKVSDVETGEKESPEDEIPEVEDFSDDVEDDEKESSGEEDDISVVPDSSDGEDVENESFPEGNISEDDELSGNEDDEKESAEDGNISVVVESSDGEGSSSSTSVLSKSSSLGAPAMPRGYNFIPRGKPSASDCDENEENTQEEETVPDNEEETVIEDATGENMLETVTKIPKSSYSDVSDSE